MFLSPSGKYTGDYSSVKAKDTVNNAARFIQASFRGNRFFKRYSLLRERLTGIKRLYLRFDNVEPAEKCYHTFYHSLLRSETETDENVPEDRAEDVASNMSNMLQATLLRKQVRNLFLSIPV